VAEAVKQKQARYNYSLSNINGQGFVLQGLSAKLEAGLVT
jgi:hypothetical protein